MDKRTFIIDNGGCSIKAGFSSDNSAKIIPNCIMKAKSERRRPFVGNQIDECRDTSALFYILPLQKGYLVNWDVQKTVWDYLFSKECSSVNHSQASIIITEPLFNFLSVQEAMTEIFFEEYECKSLVKINPSTLSFYKHKCDNSEAKCCIVVDTGYSFTHIVPYVNDTKIKEGIRRIDVGGKLLTNHLKEIISYRQLNVMDETYVINQVKEDSCFVSQDFFADMNMAKSKVDNKIVRDYILPDFTSLKRGYLTEPVVSDDRQTLRLNNERFVIPEILFHPSDIGIKQMGIPEAIIDCLKDCKEETWPHLLSNIILTGGSAKFPGFKDRVYKEVRSLAPNEYDVKIFMPENPITHAWEGGKLLADDPSTLSSLTVTRKEYEEEGHVVCYDKFDV